MVKYKVLLLRYPEEVEVEALNEEEAREIAKKKVNFSVWSVDDVEEVN